MLSDQKCLNVVRSIVLHFQESILKTCGTDRGIDDTIFQNPAKLHMTLCVMVVADDRERQETIQALHHCYNQIMRQDILFILLLPTSLYLNICLLVHFGEGLNIKFVFKSFITFSNSF